MGDSFSSRGTFRVGEREFALARLSALEDAGFAIARLPYSLRILLENLLRREDGLAVSAEDIEALARWSPLETPSAEIAFMPSRVLLQDFTGVPAVVDLAALRDAVRAMGGDPRAINPLQPVELVIDHSVQVDEYGSAAAFLINAEKEFERNRERYAFLRWGQQAFDNFRVVPPDTGIVHQVNLEYLARGVMVAEDGGGRPLAYPDTLVGTDSHTTMINGLGVLGWGVGGIEAEAAMLGQPISMLIPEVVGFRLDGQLVEGATATDLVLTVTQMLRQRGVVGKFVEFYGPGLARLPLADRATIANMAPEYGATCGIFPIDQTTLDYLAFTGRDSAQIALVEAYMKEQGLFHGADTPEAEYSDHLELDLAAVEPSLAGPRRPQDRVRLSDMKTTFLADLEGLKGGARAAGVSRPLQVLENDGGVAVAPSASRVQVVMDGEECQLDHGSVVIAAITSCTNTSNPYVMVGAGLLAKKAVERGLAVKPWVKTSLAPGSKVVTSYLDRSGLTPYLVSGNRNFEGRISPDVRANYLASPPLVVAYALAGKVDVDLHEEPLGTGSDGEPVFLRDVWPSQQEIAATVEKALQSEMFQREYADVFAGDERWNALETPDGDTYDWAADSTYVRLPPYFVDLPAEPAPVEDIVEARVLALLGDSVTTDHISPAGAIKAASPAGEYLIAQGVSPKDFNSYGSRRGNHEVMMRGTFANVRLRNELVPEIEGGYTLHLPSGEPLSIYDAAMRYQNEGVPLVVIAGREYGTGSSRDWAAKGSALLGVRAVIARSFERIHRSNLVGMGVLPLELLEGESAQSLGLSGHEVVSIEGLEAAFSGDFTKAAVLEVTARAEDGTETTFSVRSRVDTPQEALYYRHGGILQYVLRQLVS
jgi:aconitate hydratase